MKNVIPMESRGRARQARPEEYHFADMSELCAFLQHEIQLSKFKYNAIASKAGCCSSTVSNMAHGLTQYPRASTVFNILRVLGFEMVVRK